jgi:hypothetical protein
MRAVICRGVVVAAAAVFLAGCGSTSNSGGTSSVTLTGEELQTVTGNLCAVQGNATNVGNLTVNVVITYDALSATGAVIGTATAAFQIAPFSSFAYGFTKANTLGQPSSGTFSNGLACAGISNFKRTTLDVSA